MYYESYNSKETRFLSRDHEVQGPLMSSGLSVASTRSKTQISETSLSGSWGNCMMNNKNVHNISIYKVMHVEFS